VNCVRPPTEAESTQVSELILLSDCGLLTALFGARAGALLTHLQTRPRNPYSGEHTLVIAEDRDDPRRPPLFSALRDVGEGSSGAPGKEGGPSASPVVGALRDVGEGSSGAPGKEGGPSASPVVGALVASLGREMRAERLPAAHLFFQWYGAGLAARLPFLARAERALSEIGASDYYVSNIALLPESRRRGLGRQLLDAGKARARELGAERLVLDVEEHNEGARAFYLHQGFAEERPLLVDLGRGRRFVFRRLSKVL